MRRVRCPILDYSSHHSVWESVRDYFGPRVESMSEDYAVQLFNEDMQYYSDWLLTSGQNDTTRVFGKWMMWKLNTGTTNFGNLQVRKRDHIGISCCPCPYDTKASDERSEILLGEIPTEKIDHGIYYMKISARGSVYGFECTYSNCPYLLNKGTPYFFV